MPTILFGAEPNPVRVGQGEFDCPECLQRRAYHRTRVDRRVRVLGAELPGGVYGEQVECEHCRSTFRPQVLACDAGPQAPETIGEYQRALRRILCLMVAADGVVREPEIETVQAIYESVTGKRLSEEAVLSEVQEAGRTPITAARYLARVLGYLNDYGKEQVLRGAVLVSLSDGELHAREEEVVRRFGAVLHLPPGRVQHILDTVEDGWAGPSSREPSS